MITEDIKEAFTSDEHIFQQTVLLREYQFSIKGLSEPDPIKIKIYYDFEYTRGPYRFELSHYIHTPTQMGPYIPSAPNFESESLALEYGISAITEYIGAAIREGHKLDSKWFVKNEDF